MVGLLCWGWGLMSGYKKDPARGPRDDEGVHIYITRGGRGFHNRTVHNVREGALAYHGCVFADLTCRSDQPRLSFILQARLGSALADKDDNFFKFIGHWHLHTFVQMPS